MPPQQATRAKTREERVARAERDLPALVLFALAFDASWVLGAMLWNTIFVFALLVWAALAMVYGFFLISIGRFSLASRRITLIVLACISSTVLAWTFDPEWLRAPIALEAVLKDDLSRMYLTVRDDQICTIEWAAMFGVSGSNHGRCKLVDDLLLFHEPPYDPPGFLPDTALIIGDRIALDRDASGEPDFGFARYFEITYRRTTDEPESEAP